MSIIEDIERRLVNRYGASPYYLVQDVRQLIDHAKSQDNRLEIAMKALEYYDNLDSVVASEALDAIKKECKALTATKSKDKLNMTGS